MDGHEFNGRGVLAVVLIGVEGYVLKVVGQGAFLRGTDAFVEADGAEEFVKVLKSVFVLVFANHLLVAGAVQEAVQKVTDPVLPGVLLCIFNKADEPRRLDVTLYLEGAVKGDAPGF